MAFRPAITTTDISRSGLMQSFRPNQHYYRGNGDFLGNSLHLRRSNIQPRKLFILSLWSTTESSFSTSSPEPSTKPTSVVLYQKVVRSPPKSDPSLLIGLLFEYLQDDFVLPDRLPMTYHRVDDTSSLGMKEEESVLIWNSPLSPNPQVTALRVSVIAINSHDSGDENNSTGQSSNVNTPNMAMVVVEKTVVSASSFNKKFPPMLQNLFAASEKQILKALDRGLDEFMMVLPKTRRNRSVVISQNSNNGYDKTLTPQENAMLVATQLYDDDQNEANKNDEQFPTKQDSTKQNDMNGGLKNTSLVTATTILDANIIERNGVNVLSEIDGKPQTRKDNEVGESEQQKRERQRHAVLQSMNYNVTIPNSTNSQQQQQSSKAIEKVEMSIPPGLDFAVHAAKMAQAKRMKSLPKNENSTASDETKTSDEYAVKQAAKVTAQRRSKQQQQQIPSINNSNGKMRKTADPMTLEPEITMKLLQQRSPMLNDALSQRTSRAFIRTISAPSEYTSMQNPNRKSDTSSSTSSSDKKPMDKQKIKVNVVANQGIKSESNDSTRHSGIDSGQNWSTPIQKKTINLNVRENEKEPFEAVESSMFEKSGDDVTDEIYDLAQSAFEDMIEQTSEDMTPEEMLAKVMKYGTEQEMNERVGTGFVSAAFGKAKSLLREQNERRELRLRQERSQESRTAEIITTNNHDTSEVLSPSEELQRMFMAGESIAERRITTTTTASGSMGGKRTTTKQDIDDLIEAEKTVTRHARVLDEELTELMVRINKTPTEGSDGVGRNQFFDVLSGPEVYDQNVDPLTAINWPGALPGTKTVRLPKELDEAVRQAKFAAEVLTNVEEVESKDGLKSYRVGKRELSAQQFLNLQSVVKEAVEICLIDDPLVLQQEEARLQMLVDELIYQPEERMREVASNYKDLLLSDNFTFLVKKRLNEMIERDLDALRRDDDSSDEINTREREILGQLVVYAQLLLKEVQALGAELESQQLEVIRSICKVAMDPTHRTEEEAAMALSDAVRDMRPLFDEGFIAYLKYALAEEEGRLARAGLLHDPEYNQWLFVLKIVQQGVHAEIAKGINRYLEHIWYILRMETSAERRMLLEKLVDVMPTLDVRPFVQVVENIVGALGDGVRGEFDGVTALGELTNKLLQLHRDVREVLPDDRIAKMSRDADEWAARQKQRLMEQRNLTKQRLKAAQDTEYLDKEIEEFGKRGDVDRFN